MARKISKIKLCWKPWLPYTTTMTRDGRFFALVQMVMTSRRFMIYHTMSKSYETWRKFGSIVHVMGRSSMHKCIRIYICISIARIPILGWMTIYHIPCFYRGTDGEWVKTYWSNTHERCGCLVDCVDSWHLSWSLTRSKLGFRRDVSAVYKATYLYRALSCTCT